MIKQILFSFRNNDTVMGKIPNRGLSDKISLLKTANYLIHLLDNFKIYSIGGGL